MQRRTPISPRTDTLFPYTTLFRSDAGLIRASYWPDATTDYGVFAGGFDEYLAWVVPGSPAIPATQHFLGQSVIELDRDTARIETQVISYHRIDMGEAERDVSIGEIGRAHV